MLMAIGNKAHHFVTVWVLGIAFGLHFWVMVTVTVPTGYSIEHCDDDDDDGYDHDDTPGFGVLRHVVVLFFLFLLLLDHTLGFWRLLLLLVVSSVPFCLGFGKLDDSSWWTARAGSSSCSLTTRWWAVVFRVKCCGYWARVEELAAGRGSLERDCQLRGPCRPPFFKSCLSRLD